MKKKKIIKHAVFASSFVIVGVGIGVGIGAVLTATLISLGIAIFFSWFTYNTD